MPINLKTIQAGDYRHDIIFQFKTEGVDSAGAVVDIWNDDFHWRASYTPEKTDLDLRAEKRFAEIIAVFKMRYPRGKTIDVTKHRIAFVHDPFSSPIGLSFWDIYPPTNPDGRWREMQIRARLYQ